MLRNKVMVGRFLLFLALPLLGATLGLTSLHAAEPPDPADRGPDIGSKAPEFDLRDQQNHSRTLGQLRAKGIAALVFYRSADW